MSKRVSHPKNGQDDEFVKIKGFDYVEFYVSNPYQAAHFYRTMFGFKPVAYSGLETGTNDRVSFLIEQRNTRFLLTAGLAFDSPISDHVRLHGDGIKDIAFRVDDASTAFDIAVKRGAMPIMEPTIFEDEQGQVVKSTIATFGSTVHSFIQRDGYGGAFLPKFQPLSNSIPATSPGIAAIDHVAISVEQGQLDIWVEFYKEVLGFYPSHQEDISTEYSAMNSKVVQNDTGRIKFPMMEPAPGKRKSQIEEYLTFYRGAGVQHLALLSDDIIGTVRTLRTNSIEFLRTPDSYYDMLEGRIGKIEEDTARLRELNILVDRDAWGYLLQIFTKPLQGRPTFFIEVIQRRGARGFGGGNIKALFEAVERDQAARGNL
jgi:4-hydroxyphenylpyruvate dioxygenase